MITALAVILALAAGWCWGHHTRPQPRRIWACARCDDTALTADEKASFKAIARYFDQPDDPRSAA